MALMLSVGNTWDLMVSLSCNTCKSKITNLVFRDGSVCKNLQIPTSEATSICYCCRNPRCRVEVLMIFSSTTGIGSWGSGEPGVLYSPPEQLRYSGFSPWILPST